MIASLAARAVFAADVAIQEGTATFSQSIGGGNTPDQVYDLDLSDSNGWAILRDTNGDASSAIAETAVWETVSDVPQGPLIFTMHSLHTSTGQHLIGRFRWSVTTDDRSTFADGLGTGGDVTASWTVLTDPTVAVPGGMSASVLPDASILIGGVVQVTGVYQVQYALPVGGVTGIRLEVLEDASLPRNGPGHSVSNGNFVLTELQVSTDAPSNIDPIVLQEGTATFSQAFVSITSPDKVHDGIMSASNGWAILRDLDGTEDSTIDEIAVWETAVDLAGGPIHFAMHQLHSTNTQHMIGRFRWSVTSDPRDTFADGLDNDGDVDASWTVLSDPEVSLPVGMSHTVLGDDSILVDGTIPDTGEYRVTYELPFPGVTGIRLEVLEHSSLPLKGPGYHAGNGNFLLTELVVTADILPAVPALGVPGSLLTALALTASARLAMRRDASRRGARQASTDAP